MPEVAIAASALTKAFGNTLAVDHLDFSLRAGRIFGLLGSNGAGKSTALKLFAGLIMPTSGKVVVLGCDVARRSAELRARIGYVPERHFIYPWMRVREVIRFTSAFYPTWNFDLANELCSSLGLDAAKRVKHLSHGMLAKLALLLALAHEPALLLLDEPTNGLDPLTRRQFLDALKTLPQLRERTVVLSSHNVSDIERTADEVGFMIAGRLAISGRVADLLGRTRRIHVRLAAESGPFVPPRNSIWQRGVDREWVVVARDVTSATLDEVRQANRCERVDEQAISLEDIFLAYARGRVGR